MKMKKLAAVLGLTLGLGLGAAHAETVLRLGSVVPTKSPWGAWAVQAAQEVEKVSGGKLKIQLLLDGQIGDELTMVRQAAKGRLDIAMVSNDPIAVDIPEMDLMTGAYLFDTDEQGTCVQYKHLSQLFNPLMEKSGLRALTWMEVGHSIIFSKTPLRTPQDMAGLKIRVAQGIVKNDYMQKLGAAASPLGTADTIPALQTGTITAVTYPTVYGVAVGIPKLAPNILVTKHQRPVGVVAVSDRTWKKLSKQEQEWLSVMAPMGPQLTNMIFGAEKALLDKAAEAGAKVHNLTPEEEKAWRATAVGLLPSSAKKIGPNAVSMLAKLEAAKQACGK